MIVATYWFKGSGDLWHAIREDSPEALCGQLRIRHNVDDTATHISTIPPSGVVHDQCREIVTKAERT